MNNTPAKQAEIDGLIDNLPTAMKPIMRVSFQEQREISNKVSEIASVVMGCDRRKTKGLVALMEEHDKRAMDWRQKHEQEGEQWRSGQTRAVQKINNTILTVVGAGLAVNFVLGVLWAMGWLKIPHP